jgi:hypothetical protein
MDALQESTGGQGRAPAQDILKEFANEHSGAELRVIGAIVAATYIRDNPTNLYFGLNYDPNDHIYLSEIAPAQDGFIRPHVYWASVVKTYPDRQLSFELAIDEPAFQRLQPGQVISFTCEIAAVIRGRSVYGIPISIELVDANGHPIEGADPILLEGLRRRR